MADKKKTKKKKIVRKRVKKISSTLDKVILPITYTQYRKKCCVNDEKEKENISLTNKLLMELFSKKTDKIQPAISQQVSTQTDIAEYAKKRPFNKQYAFKETEYFNNLRKNKPTVISDFTSGETTDVFAKSKFSKRGNIDTETEVEGYVPIKNLPNYAFGKPLEKPPLNIAPSLTEETVSIPTETVEQPKVIFTGEKRIIKRKKPRPPLILEEDGTNGLGVALGGEAVAIQEKTTPDTKKKPISRMNKSELQQKYRDMFNEEPDKRFSKKELYSILK